MATISIRNPKGAARAGRSMHRLVLAVLVVPALATLVACPQKPFPGEQEERAFAEEDVPEAVRAAAAGFCARIGGARCAGWSWDAENEDWECRLKGLERRAEIDITPAGLFSELELVYSYEEVLETLPDVAEFIRKKCRGEKGVFVELSLRRETFLDEIPALAEAWTKSGVAIEFQCPNGRDFEVDARHLTEMRPFDDTTDADEGEEAPR